MCELRAAAVAGTRLVEADIAHDGGRGVRGFGDRAEHDDAVCDVDGLIDVVRHEQHRRGLLVVDREEQVLHLQSGQRVEGAERLIEQEDAWATSEGACE